MKVTLDLQEGISFLAKDEAGYEVRLDGPPSIGGNDSGFRPMEMVLIGLASCAAVDVVHILRKGKQEIESLKIEVTGERVDDIPAVFKAIKVHFSFTGQLDDKKIERALNLSFEKYCSVSKMLQPQVQIDYSHKIL